MSIDLVWRKSSYSSSGNSGCVEVADGIPDRIPIRDSKNAPDGPSITFSTAPWAAFLTALAAGRAGAERVAPSRPAPDSGYRLWAGTPPLPGTVSA